MQKEQQISSDAKRIGQFHALFMQGVIKANIYIYHIIKNKKKVSAFFSVKKP